MHCSPYGKPGGESGSQGGLILLILQIFCSDPTLPLLRLLRYSAIHLEASPDEVAVCGESRLSGPPRSLHPLLAVLTACSGSKLHRRSCLTGSCGASPR